MTDPDRAAHTPAGDLPVRSPGPPPQMPSPNLERLLRPVHAVSLDAQAGDGPRWEWLRAGDWRLPARPRSGHGAAGAVVERFRLDSGAIVDALKLTENGSVFVPFDLDEAYGNYVSEAWREAGEVRALSDRQLGLYMRLKPL